MIVLFIVLSQKLVLIRPLTISYLETLHTLPSGSEAKIRITRGSQRVGVLCLEHPHLRHMHLALHVLRLSVLSLTPHTSHEHTGMQIDML